MIRLREIYIPNVPTYIILLTSIYYHWFYFNLSYFVKIAFPLNSYNKQCRCLNRLFYTRRLTLLNAIVPRKINDGDYFRVSFEKGNFDLLVVQTGCIVSLAGLFKVTPVWMSVSVFDVINWESGDLRLGLNKTFQFIPTFTHVGGLFIRTG